MACPLSGRQAISSFFGGGLHADQGQRIHHHRRRFGLGAGTGAHAGAQGGKVVLADLNEAAGEALAQELGANARFVPTDVPTRPAPRAASSWPWRPSAACTGLVNCAGIAPAEKVLGGGAAFSWTSFAGPSTST
jgi:NAD(P)-dependent dehydrogenase (short-subunit alcohol dehydrogenase family)